MEESRPEQPKRKRVAQACCTCKTKKIRCDGKQPSCTYCLDHNLECVFVQSQKRRGPRKCANHDLEERLVRMEMLLDTSRVITNSTNDLTSPQASEAPMSAISCTPGSSLPQTIGETGSIMGDANRSRSIHSIAESGGFDQRNTENAVEDANDMDYSPPVQWIIEKADDSSAINGAFTEAGMFEPLKGVKGINVLPSGLKRPVYIPLPPKEEVIRLVEVFFHGYNRFFPLFDPPSFMALVERQFSSEPDKRVGWWASLNTVIAIGIRLQGSDSRDATGQAWGYMHNAFGVLTELLIRSPDLLNVQALLSLAVLVQGNGDPQATAMLVSDALRLLNILGLQRKPGGENDLVVARQSRRTFWIACRMDRELSMVLKLPLIQNSADINIEIPESDPPDGLGDVSHSEGTGKINIFRLTVELSVIEAEIHKGLYTAEASRQSDEELVQTIIRLDQQLEEWKVSVPIDFQPEYEIKTSDFYLRQYIITLHFNYYNCLSNIHYACLCLSKSSHISPETSCQIVSSKALYMSAARAMIRLTRYISKETPPFVWRTLCYPILATITLLVSIRDDPNQPRALTDVTLLGSMVSFLSKMEDLGISAIYQIRRVCMELERIARETVERAQLGLKRQKLQSQQGVDRYPDSVSSIVSCPSNEPFGKGISGYPNLESNRGTTTLPSESFGDSLTNGYMDQESMFGAGLPLWNSENLHEDLLAGFLPQYYGQLEVQLGDD